MLRVVRLFDGSMMKNEEHLQQLSGRETEELMIDGGIKERGVKSVRIGSDAMEH